MADLTRRNFLKALAAAATVFGTSGWDKALANAFTDDSFFTFLVVGDSIVWGQGLEEKDKFYSITADWLRSDVFRNRRNVNVNVKAHSGSTLTFHEDEAEKYRTAGCDENYFHHSEVNIGFPSITKQIEAAAEEYRAAGNTHSADLIMLTGGITDVTVSTILDPNGDNEKLPALIEKHCRDDMFEVIHRAATLNSNALVVVVGYFPMLSPKTPSSKLLNDLLEAKGFPRPLKPVVNNSLMRHLFFSNKRKKSIIRSRIWVEESNKSLRAAVDKLNQVSGKRRAVFVQSPITEDTCLETPNSLLFKMGKKGVVEDPLFHSRSEQCDMELHELKRTTGIKYPVRRCEIAAVGHPNPAGAKAYAESIKNVLKPIFSDRNF